MDFEQLLQTMLGDARERNDYYQSLRRAALALNERYQKDRYKDYNASTVNDENVAEQRAEASEYRRLMGNLLDASQIYLKHCNEDTPAGKGTGNNTNRKQLAKDFIKTLTPEYGDVLKAEDRLHDRELRKVWDMKYALRDGEAIKAGRAPLTPEEKLKKLRQISAIQRNIGGSGIVPKERVFSAAPSSSSETWAKIKHRLTQVLAAISIIGGIAWGISALLTRWSINRKKEQLRGVEYDTTLIPGSQKDHFEETDSLLERVNALDANQPILDEKKRLPIIFENPVPGNPDAKPTITLKVMQLKAGDELEYSGSAGMGHSFITLQYTKNNPLTGKPQRYEVTMGFYPKGGYGGKSISAAMLNKGMYIPGQLHNDFGHNYSIAKSFDIDNQRVNRILLKAQEYEKEGYSYFGRNCTTFLHDMAVEANIHADDFIKECPISTENTAKASTVGFLVGDAMSRVGVNTVLDKVGKADSSYQRHGQAMLSEKYIQQLDKMEFRAQLRGYAPSHVAESLRAEKGLKLDTQSAPTEEIFNARGKEKFKSIVDNIDLKTHDLFAELDKFARDNRLPDLDSVNINLRDFIDTRKNIVEQLGEQLYSGGDISSRTKKLDECIKSIDETVDALTDMYQTSYKEHPDLNVAFRRMTGAFNLMKSTLISARIDAPDALLYDESNRERMLSSQSGDFAEIVDPSLDCAAAMRDMMFMRSRYTMSVDGTTRCRAFTAAEIGAGIRAFGNFEDMFQYRNMLARYGSEGPQRDSTPEDRALQKTWHKLSIKSMSVSDFKAAQQSIMNTEKLYPSDYTFAFITLPQEEDKHLFNPNSGKCAANTYQTLALEHAFGMKTTVREVTAQNGQTLQYEEVSRNGLKKPLLEMKGSASDFKKKISDILAENIRGNKSFEAMRTAFTENAMQRTRYNSEKESMMAYNANIKAEVHRQMMDGLKDIYLDSVLSEVRAKNPAAPDISSIDFAKDPEFESLRKAVCEQSGISLDVQFKRQNCYDALKRMKENGLFDNAPANNAQIKTAVSTILVLAAISESDSKRLLNSREILEQATAFSQKPGFSELLTRDKLESMLSDYEKNGKFSEYEDNDEKLIVTGEESRAIESLAVERTAEFGQEARQADAAARNTSRNIMNQLEDEEDAAMAFPE